MGLLSQKCFCAAGAELADVIALVTSRLPCILIMMRAQQRAGHMGQGSVESYRLVPPLCAMLGASGEGGRSLGRGSFGATSAELRGVPTAPDLSLVATLLH